jgi:hypothetical protein
MHTEDSSDPLFSKNRPFERKQQVAQRNGCYGIKLQIPHSESFK